MKRLAWALAAWVAGSVAASAQAVEADFEAIRNTRIVTAVRITETISVDGRLNEPAWAHALPATDFIQKFPNNGTPSDERTEVRVLYDDDNLYVGVIAFDSHPGRSLIKELKKISTSTATDLIQVIIDSLHDGRSGFSLSPSIRPARSATISCRRTTPDRTSIGTACGM